MTGNNSSNNRARQTTEFWQRRTTRELSLEDGREIAENIAGFFSLLFEWSLVDSSDSGDVPDEEARPPPRRG